MMRRPFYQVNPSAYLFNKQHGKPEEEVRQWVLFELLCNYGISINNIEIERAVKIGTKNLFADIVIHKENVPYIVIECKHRGYNKVEEGLDQAISYADANSVKAEFAIFTNGELWYVRRKIKDKWVSVPDIPKRIDQAETVELDHFLYTIKELMPLLYWLNGAIPSENAQHFFSALQRFFNRRLCLDTIESDLECGTDNLLRVISTGSLYDNYGKEKLTVAYDCFMSYLANLNPDQKNERRNLFNIDIRDMLTPMIRFFELMENSYNICHEENILIRFIYSLLQYLFEHKELLSSKKYPAIPELITNEFRSLLSILFYLKFGIEFPDPLSIDRYSEIKRLCENEWNVFCKNES